MKKKLCFIGNRGSAALEASLAVPVFLLAMVYLYLTFQSVLADALVYEAAAETAGYMAELSYTDVCNLSVAYLMFPDYIDETDTVDRYIEGGNSGVSFIGTDTMDTANWISLCVTYTPKYAEKRRYTVRQRAYVGNKGTEQTGTENAQVYVYVTDHQQVYHSTRTCTYLQLSIRTSAIGAAKKQGYQPCEFCGADSGTMVYITDEGRKYHSRISCSGLKRTVYRKKKSEIGGLGPCSRCGTK